MHLCTVCPTTHSPHELGQLCTMIPHYTALSTFPCLIPLLHARQLLSNKAHWQDVGTPRASHQRTPPVQKSLLWMLTTHTYSLSHSATQGSTEALSPRPLHSVAGSTLTVPTAIAHQDLYRKATPGFKMHPCCTLNNHDDYASCFLAAQLHPFHGLVGMQVQQCFA